MNLRVLALMPIIMIIAWFMAAMLIFSFSISGDQDFNDGVVEKIKKGVMSFPLLIPLPMSLVSPLPVSQDYLKEDFKSFDSPDIPPLPPQQKAPVITPLEPAPALWKLQEFEVVENKANSFEGKFTYYGGRLASTITYQTNPSIWIIDLPADWDNEIKNDYRWSEGLVRRLALGMHNGYLRLVLYLREPHGGRKIIPAVTALDQHTFSITLQGAPVETRATP